MDELRKMDPEKAKAYFRLRTTLIFIYIAIGACVSFGVVFFAQELSSISVMGIPLPYYMGSQGAVLTFIFLLFFNAKISDVIDVRYGIVKKKSDPEEDKVVNQ